jgi:hypothetical protein
MLHTGDRAASFMGYVLSLLSLLMLRYMYREPSRLLT